MPSGATAGSSDRPSATVGSHGARPARRIRGASTAVGSSSRGTGCTSTGSSASCGTPRAIRNPTLPYWNYLDDPAKRTLPRALSDELDANGKPNPLFEARRAPGINDRSLSLSQTAVTYSLDTIPFFPTVAGEASFGGNVQFGAANNGTGAGSLEAGPHNTVHGEVGGDEGMREFQLPAPGVINYHCSLHPTMTGSVTIVDDPTLPRRARNIQIVDFAFVPDALTVPVGTTVRWINLGDTEHTVALDDLPFDTGPIPPNGYMALPRISSRDPVFWLHHANVDRVWERWLAKKGGRRNPIDQPAWMDQEFTFFDTNGAAMPKLVKQFLDTKCLGYRYDDPSPSTSPTSRRTAARPPLRLPQPRRPGRSGRVRLMRRS